MVAGDEIGRVDGALGAVGAHNVYVASSATVIVIIGPAGSDMQMLPPTVAEFHTLNEARNASQLVVNSGAARQSIRRRERIQVSDGARGTDLQTGLARHQGVPAQRREIDEAAQARAVAPENSHVPPANQASPSRQSRSRPIRRSPNHVGDGVEIHGRTPGRKVVVLATDPQ